MIFPFMHVVITNSLWTSSECKTLSFIKKDVINNDNIFLCIQKLHYLTLCKTNILHHKIQFTNLFIGEANYPHTDHSIAHTMFNIQNIYDLGVDMTE